MTGLLHAFGLQFGGFMLLAAAVAGWLFRYSTAHTAFKIILPSVLVLLACTTWPQVRALMGYPVQTDFASLPYRAELIAFLPYDDDKRVDLWLRVGSASPRAYDVEMDGDLKKTLKQAQAQQEQGNQVMLRKKGKQGRPGTPHYIDIDGGKAPYELDQNAFSLPPKGNP
jgi:hypothetical protein